MDKTDFIQVHPPLGPVIVLSGNYRFIAPAFDENGKLARIDFYPSYGKSFYYEGDEAIRIADTLNSRFGLSIGKSVSLDKILEVKSSLADTK